jgi:hypothetical protein
MTAREKKAFKARLTREIAGFLERDAGRAGKGAFDVMHNEGDAFAIIRLRDGQPGVRAYFEVRVKEIL